MCFIFFSSRSPHQDRWWIINGTEDRSIIFLQSQFPNKHEGYNLCYSILKEELCLSSCNYSIKLRHFSYFYKFQTLFPKHNDFTWITFIIEPVVTQSNGIALETTMKTLEVRCPKACPTVNKEGNEDENPTYRGSTIVTSTQQQRQEDCFLQRNSRLMCYKKKRATSSTIMDNITGFW